MTGNIDIHLTLPTRVAKELDAQARNLGLCRAQMIRVALERYLAEGEREACAAEMRAYAQAMAPHSAEFVRGTGPSVRMRWLESTEW